MNCFIVMSPSPEIIEKAVQENFPDHHYQVRPTVWAVACANKASSDICNMLGIGVSEDSSFGAGVVI